MAVKRKQQQWLIFGLVIAIVGALFFVTSTLLGGRSGALLSTGQDGRIDTRIVADRTSGASPEDVWIGSTNQRLEELLTQNATLTARLDEIAAQNERNQEALKSEFDAKLQEQANGAINYIDGLAQAELIKDQTSTGSEDVSGIPSVETAALSGGLDEFIVSSGQRTQTVSATDPVTSVTGQTAGVGSEIAAQPFRVTFNLNQRPEPSGGFKRKTVSEYVPAGSYAPGIVLTGAEAKTGTQNALAPVPVVIKITGPAVGPSDGHRSTQIDLTGCRATGSAIGDLSSERVSVRLDSLSCVRGSYVYEAQIAAYVSGNGQQGVRGRLYSRAGPAVKNASIAAALEGLGGAISGTGSTVIGADGAGTSDILKTVPIAAAGGAAQGAASKLADYYIDRAEEIAPVVSLYAGTEINIVFLEGADLSGGGQ